MLAPCLAPFAVAADGTVFVNVAQLQGDVALTKRIDHARRMDGVLFLGIAVTRPEKKRLLRAVDSAGTEVVTRMGWTRQRFVTRRGRRSLSKKIQ